jgi:GNAT superfamily N-acetyltransferase
MAPSQIEISADHARLDVAAIHAFLTTSYWAAGRPREVVERSIRLSLCFGAYDGSTQVGFGRVITDQTVFAYLADVFVIEAYRRRGIGRALVAAMLADPRLADVPQFLLRTRDAHGIYELLGFEPAPRPQELMALAPHSGARKGLG